MTREHSESERKNLRWAEGGGFLNIQFKLEFSGLDNSGFWFWCRNSDVAGHPNRERKYPMTRRRGSGRVWRHQRTVDQNGPARARSLLDEWFVGPTVISLCPVRAPKQRPPPKRYPDRVPRVSIILLFLSIYFGKNRRSEKVINDPSYFGSIYNTIYQLSICSIFFLYNIISEFLIYLMLP